MNVSGASVNLNSMLFFEVVHYFHEKLKVISPKEAVYKMQKMGATISTDTFYAIMEGKLRADIDKFLWFWVRTHPAIIDYIGAKLRPAKQMILPFPEDESHIPIIASIGRTLAGYETVNGGNGK